MALRTSLQVEEQNRASGAPSISRSKDIFSSRMDQILNRASNTGSPAYPSSSPNPIPIFDNVKARQVEELLWKKYGLTGRLVPDELLKECRKN